METEIKIYGFGCAGCGCRVCCFAAYSAGVHVFGNDSACSWPMRASPSAAWTSFCRSRTPRPSNAADTISTRSMVPHPPLISSMVSTVGESDSIRRLRTASTTFSLIFRFVFLHCLSNSMNMSRLWEFMIAQCTKSPKTFNQKLSTKFSCFRYVFPDCRIFGF